jgi:branched-chain amino acid transport system permease protein
VYASLVAVVLATLYAMNRLVQSRYGLVLRATMVNERRVNALGSPSLPYRLVAYVLSAEICALGGFFLVNITGFVSPANMTWAISGELIVMVLLGGVGTVFGPVVGAVGFMLLEEGLKLLTEHWPLIMGPLIVLMVLFFKKGIWGLLSQPADGKGAAGDQGGHA